MKASIWNRLARDRDGYPKACGVRNLKDGEEIRVAAKGCRGRITINVTGAGVEIRASEGNMVVTPLARNWIVVTPQD